MRHRGRAPRTPGTRIGAGGNVVGVAAADACTLMNRT